jgi:hypothetical protein
MVSGRVHEAVLRLTPFRHEDFRAGRWPKDEIAAKVRLVLAESSGVSFDRIKNETVLEDLCNL